MITDSIFLLVVIARDAKHKDAVFFLQIRIMENTDENITRSCSTGRWRIK